MMTTRLAWWTLMLLAATRGTDAQTAGGLHLAEDASEIRFGPSSDSVLRRAGAGLLELDGALAVCGGIFDASAAAPPAAPAKTVFLYPDAAVASISWPTETVLILDPSSDVQLHAEVSLAPFPLRWWLRPSDESEPIAHKGGVAIPESSLYRLTANTAFGRANAAAVSLGVVVQRAGSAFTACQYTAERVPFSPASREPLRLDCFLTLYAGDTVSLAIDSAAGPVAYSDVTQLLIRKVTNINSFRSDAPILTTAGGLPALMPVQTDMSASQNSPNPEAVLARVYASSPYSSVYTHGTSATTAWFRIDLSFTASVSTTFRDPVDLSIAVKRGAASPVIKGCRVFFRLSESAAAAPTFSSFRVTKSTACYIRLTVADMVSIVPTADTGVEGLTSDPESELPALRLTLESIESPQGFGVHGPVQIASVKYTKGLCLPSQHSSHSPLSTTFPGDMSLPAKTTNFAKLPDGQSTRLMHEAGHIIVDGDPTAQGIYELDLIYHHHWNGTVDESLGAPFDLALGVWRQGVGKVDASHCRLVFEAAGADTLHYDSTYHATCLVRLQGQDQIYFFHRQSNCLWDSGDVIALVRQL